MAEASADPDTDIVTDGDEDSPGWSSCEKNPKHEKFIPVSSFKIKDIPKPYNNLFYYNFIIAMASITVRLTLKFVSQARPDGYVFAQQRGKRVTVMGSGCVSGIEENYDIEKCPCPQCKDSKHEKRKGWFFRIRTATHVIFDREEAKNTTVDVFYDNRHKKEDMRTLYGVGVVNADVETDICEMVCVTHDEAIYKKLKDNLRIFNALQEMKFSSHGGTAFPGINVIVSHPHGTSKQISFQRWESYEEKQPVLYFIDKIYDDGKKTFALFVEFMERGLGVIRSAKSQDNLRADGTEEAALTNLEIQVIFPDGEVSPRNIWMWNEPVKKSKEFLLRVAGIHEKPEEYCMFLNIPPKKKVVLDDDVKMIEYMAELTEALSLGFKHCNEGDTNGSKGSESGPHLPGQIQVNPVV